MGNDRTIIAVLLISTNCPHCAALLDVLNKMVKYGDIGSLEIINTANLPQRAAEFGVRTVPWLRLGPFDLEGARTEAEIRRWLEKANDKNGLTDYMAELLNHGNLDKVIHMIRINPELLERLIDLMAGSDTDMKVLLGIGAVFEELEGEPVLHHSVSKLGELTQHHSSKIRADAAHYLSFSKNKAAIPYLQALKGDSSKDVREISIEALLELT